MNAISRDKKQENRPSTNFISRRNLLVTSTSVFAAASIQSSALITSAKAQQHGPARTVTPSSEELTQRTTERRGVEVAIWGMPIVNFDAMRQAFFRDAKATYSDIMFWSKPGSWKLQCLTPNTSVRYVFSFINTSQAGPVVVELPATADAALNGTIIDAWQVPLTDVGIAGEDQGKGGKYLLVPPDYRGDVPAGYIAVPMKTYNGFVGLRVITKSEDEASVRSALNYLRLIRIYPLSKSNAPPQSTFVDMADTLWDAVAQFDNSFYTSLARMVSEEPVQPRDAGMMRMLRTLQRGHIDYGLVPVENSIGGGIVDTLDAFLNSSARICAEVRITIHHYLLAREPWEKVKTIYSKPEVFSQCRNWLSAVAKDFGVVPGKTKKASLDAIMDKITRRKTTHVRNLF